MSFEVNTLFLLTIDVEAILGLLLLLVWVQNTRVHAVAWWASTNLMRAISIILYGLYGSVPDLVSIDLANVLLFSSFGVTWNGARVFNGHNALPGSLVAGAALWLLASQWPGFEMGSEMRGQLSAMIIATYAWLTAYEFWRGRSEQQVARDRPIGVLLIDLDSFKSINDRFGHPVGDKVLQIFAKTARGGLRQTDLVGRLGGEEFIVILADAGADNAYLVADRLRNG